MTPVKSLIRCTITKCTTCRSGNRKLNLTCIWSVVADSLQAFDFPWTCSTNPQQIKASGAWFPFNAMHATHATHAIKYTQRTQRTQLTQQRGQNAGVFSCVASVGLNEKQALEGGRKCRRRRRRRGWNGRRNRAAARAMLTHNVGSSGQLYERFIDAKRYVRPSPYRRLRHE